MINESVTHVLKQFGIINEVFLVGDKNTAEYLIAYRDKVWLFANEEEVEDMGDDRLVEIQNATGVDDENFDDVHHWGEIHEQRPDIVFARIEGDELIPIYSNDEFAPSVNHHNALNKVARAIGLKYITDRQGRYHNPQRRARLPDRMFHGTDWDSARSIMLLGLRPLPQKSRYFEAGVVHHKHVFLSTRLEKSSYHASNAARKANSFPVVIEFEIPDKRLLDPDYDIDTMAQQSHYADVRSRAKFDGRPGQVPQKSMGLSRDLGIMGYAGRIPPSAITRLIVPIEISDYVEDTDESNFRTFTPEQFRNAVKLWKEHDLGDVISYDEDGADGSTDQNPLLQIFDQFWMAEFLANREDGDEDDEDEDR